MMNGYPVLAGKSAKAAPVGREPNISGRSACLLIQACPSDAYMTVHIHAPNHMAAVRGFQSKLLSKNIFRIIRQKILDHILQAVLDHITVCSNAILMLLYLP